MKETKRICVNVDAKLLEEFDNTVKNFDKRCTRTEALSYIMRLFIQKMKEYDKKTGD